jgi:hypothetical protein
MEQKVTSLSPSTKLVINFEPTLDSRRSPVCDIIRWLLKEPVAFKGVQIKAEAISLKHVTR